ncbi:hypothetical protein, unlikely [Trypanosoma brucei gambiense DAL972]|uniref:Uncharacterized protein n=1 Tax=Trypanosoma brucei gambiense (strain MHOM/CI/86/DAL972) TaxID=679716 RepID=C9ZU70_TRYB9|nr:hypothetical protein, unlikely [Trypanosoma brucei gambiense DAL972]CBH12956.1 hypothetical protein, unlikely [Trypanosoma brucei gambiense DAL972]|eukprot:XP_011775235.1 hypothetical protein, unlikely [Trypanosoma brucei gambiense DAL972]
MGTEGNNIGPPITLLPFLISHLIHYVPIFSVVLLLAFQLVAVRLLMIFLSSTFRYFFSLYFKLSALIRKVKYISCRYVYGPVTITHTHTHTSPLFFTFLFLVLFMI